MSALPTRIEKEAGRPLTSLQIFDITASRETTLSRLLMLYISTGLLFMLLPGTFLGLWNLLAISSHHAADSVSAGWIQAHGHAQIFGWIGTFILGIGFYSIPKLRRLNSFALSVVWSSWALWTTGYLALVDQRLPMAVENTSACVGRTRTGCLRNFLPHGFRSSSSRL